MSDSEKEPLINPNPTLQKYYGSLESRIGYKIFLGGTRHFGYYETESSSPVPIGPALRSMEDQLFDALCVGPNSYVLDAGCGVGHVALHMAKRGDIRIQAIDVVERHVQRAQRNIKAAGYERMVSARVMDYHHLESFASDAFDGIYTMETLVHATDPLAVLREFYRLLKPGGRIALHEYDHVKMETTATDLSDAMGKVNKYAAMPANAMFDQGVLEQLLEEAGFEDVRLHDLSKHIVPMLWLFYLVAIIPYTIFKLLGIETRFVNTLAGVESYRGRHLWRYIQLSARKPAARSQGRKRVA